MRFTRMILIAAPLNGDKVFFSSCLEKYHRFAKTHKDRIKGALTPFIYTTHTCSTMIIS
jgi:hypothetical protein